MWHVEFSSKAVKQLSKIDKRQRMLIESWIIDNLEGCENPRAVHGGKQLVGTDTGWRYRVGSYRLICGLNDGLLLVEIIRAGHRQGVYSNLPKI